MNAATHTLHVLCVDDDIRILSMVADTLEPEGYHVETAVNGSHALEKIALSQPPFDLIIADSRMPHLDGWRLIMRARAAGYKGKIVLFSAWLDEQERRRYAHLEIDRIIEKPPQTGELLRVVKEIATTIGTRTVS